MKNYADGGQKPPNSPQFVTSYQGRIIVLLFIQNISKFLTRLPLQNIILFLDTVSGYERLFILTYSCFAYFCNFSVQIY